MMKLVTPALLSTFLVACPTGPFPAPATAVIEDMEDYGIVPSSAHLSQDGVGTLLLGDILIFDEVSEMPLNNIEVEILTGWSGIYVLPETAIKLVDYPSAPDDVTSAEDVKSYCDIDPDDGYIDASAPDWCSWWWDTESGLYYEFGGDYAMTPDNYQPTYMIGGTDNRGLCRFYLYIDSLPNNGEEEFDGASFWVSIGVDSLTIEIEAD